MQRNTKKRLSVEQRNELEIEYVKKDNVFSTEVRKQFAEKFGVTENKINNWYYGKNKKCSGTRKKKGKIALNETYLDSEGNLIKDKVAQLLKRTELSEYEIKEYVEDRKKGSDITNKEKASDIVNQEKASNNILKRAYLEELLTGETPSKVEWGKIATEAKKSVKEVKKWFWNKRRNNIHKKMKEKLRAEANQILAEASLEEQRKGKRSTVEEATSIACTTNMSPQQVSTPYCNKRTIDRSTKGNKQNKKQKGLQKSMDDKIVVTENCIKLACKQEIAKKLHEKSIIEIDFNPVNNVDEIIDRNFVISPRENSNVVNAHDSWEDLSLYNLGDNEKRYVTTGNFFAKVGSNSCLSYASNPNGLFFNSASSNMRAASESASEIKMELPTANRKNGNEW